MRPTDQQLAILQPQLLRVAMTIVRRRTDAEDVVQDALERLLVSELRNKTSLASWLVRTTRNCALDHVRATVPEESQACDAEAVDEWGEAPFTPELACLGDIDVADLLQSCERVDRAVRILLALGERQRGLFVLVAAFDTEVSVAARLTTTTPAAAYVMLRRARERVRAIRDPPPCDPLQLRAVKAAIAARDPIQVLRILAPTTLSAARRSAYDRARGDAILSVRSPIAAYRALPALLQFAVQVEALQLTRDETANPTSEELPPAPVYDARAATRSFPATSDRNRVEKSRAHAAPSRHRSTNAPAPFRP